MPFLWPAGPAQSQLKSTVSPGLGHERVPEDAIPRARIVGSWAGSAREGVFGFEVPAPFPGPRSSHKIVTAAGFI